MVTRNDLCVSTRAIYFAHWPMNGIGGGQHSVVSTALWASPFRTFHVLGVRHMMRMCIPSCQSLNEFLHWLGWWMRFDDRVCTLALRELPTLMKETSSCSKKAASNSIFLAPSLCTLTGVQPWWPVLLMYSNPGMLSLNLNLVDLAVHRWFKLLQCWLSVGSFSLPEGSWSWPFLYLRVQSLEEHTKFDWFHTTRILESATTLEMSA